MTEAFEIRQPEPRDARDISRLFLDRYDDILPGRQSWKPARKRYLEKHGEGYFLDKINRAHDFPKANFGAIATVDDELAGFAYAVADPSNQLFARLVGLVVSRDYEGERVGTRLEIERQGWADVNDRVLYGQVVYEDEVTRAFYRYSGYREVGTRVMAETVFQLIEHTPPALGHVATLDIPWATRLSDEPLVY